jgi:tetratricopeptide (TPR) repeat protein
VLILLLLIVLAFIFQKKIIQFFNTESNNDSSVNNILPVSDEVYVTDALITRAENYLKEDNLDSALFSYRSILIDNPMHVGALNGIEIIADKFIMKGNLNKQQGNFSAALEYYQRAAELKPNDKNIAGLIADCKIEIKKASELEINSGPDKGTEDRNPIPDQNQSVEQNNPDLILSSFMQSDWKFENLNEKDYSIDQEKLTFFSSGKLKKGFYNQSMEDVDVKVSLLLQNKSVDQRAGIIVGYDKTDDLIDNYYLFSADIYGNFLLKKYFNGKEEKLVFVKKNITPVNNSYQYKLKIKCLGPWIMIYNDEKLLDSFLNKDFVKGKIGLFAESGTIAEFSNFKVTSAFENKEKK